MSSLLPRRYRYSAILLRELVITEFKLRYQGSALGYLWSLLRPLFLFVILYFVFVYFLKIGSTIPHWPVALLLGIVLWNFFSEITNNGLGSIVGRGDVLRKINFPKYVVLLASSISALINLGLNLIVIVVFMIINRVDVSWTALLTPIYIAEIFLFGLGLAFLLSAIFVRLRDINYIWEIIMQALFYASAVIYPISYFIESAAPNFKPHPMIAQLVLLNPASQAIQDARHALVSKHNLTMADLTQNPVLLVAPFIVVIVTFLAGAWYFKRKSPTFAESV